jgi:hypothetical protein
LCQLNPPNTAAPIRDCRNPKFFLGHDWNPKDARIFQ